MLISLIYNYIVVYKETEGIIKIHFSRLVQCRCREITEIFNLDFITIMIFQPFVPHNLYITKYRPTGNCITFLFHIVPKFSNMIILTKVP